MTLAAAIEGRTADAKAWSRASRIASVDIVHDLAQAEAVWRGLEAQFSTPYQRFDLLGAWQRRVGERENFWPFIVIARDADSSDCAGGTGEDEHGRRCKHVSKEGVGRVVVIGAWQACIFNEQSAATDPWIGGRLDCEQGRNGLFQKCRFRKFHHDVWRRR